MKKSINKFVIIVFILLTILSCGKKDSRPLAATKKIVILSPEIAEIVCEIGGKKNIVAVTRECDFPKSLENKLKVGSFSKPNLEKIISLQPDVVMLSGLEQEIVKSNFGKLGIKTFQFYPADMDSLFSAILEIGKIVGKEKNAEKLVKKFRVQLKESSLTKSRPKIYIEIYNKPIMTVSSASFIGNLIESSGGQNLFPRLPRDYCRISAERVIAENPNIIFILYPGVTKSEVANRLGWDKIDAVKNNRIYTPENLKTDHFLRAGPRSLLAMEKIDSIVSNYHE